MLSDAQAVVEMLNQFTGVQVASVSQINRKEVGKINPLCPLNSGQGFCKASMYVAFLLCPTAAVSCHLLLGNQGRFCISQQCCPTPASKSL